MKTCVWLFAFLFAATSFAENKDVVIHPQPKDPIYLDASWYSTLKKGFSSFPEKGSKDQAKDEAELIEYEKTRTAKDCARANSEVHVTLANLYGPSSGLLTEEQVTTLAPFFEKIRNEADFFIQKLKSEYHRPRPFLYLPLHPCVPKEVTDAYPSGHATISALFALELADIFPKKAEQFKARAKQIGDDRVLAGVHHPTDIKSGTQLANSIYNELKKSPKFEAEIKKIQTSVK